MINHYCPCFYTMRWTDAKGNLVHYCVVHGKVVSRYVAPAGTGYEVDLYAKKNVPENEKHTIETGCYKGIDNDGAIILEKIITNGLDILTLNEKTAWCRFIVSMLTRHPFILQNAKRMGKEVFQRRTELVTSLQQAYCQIVHKDEIKYLEDNGAVETISNMSTFNSRFNLGICEKYANTLLKMTWWIDDFSHASFDLLTSDYPVLILPLSAKSRLYSSLTEALLSGDYVLLFPLSPRLCFSAWIGGRMQITNTSKMVELLNINTIASAKNFVYARNKSQLNFVEERLLAKKQSLPHGLSFL